MKLDPGSKWNFVYICADFCNQRAFLNCILMTLNRNQTAVQ